MVEVIKPGTKNLADCGDCGNTLKYYPFDVWKETDPPRGPFEMESYDHYFIRCPCGSKIDVTSKVSGNIAKIVEEIEKHLDDIDL